MSVDEGWRARLDAPHPKSYLAFLLGVNEEVDRIDGPMPMIWAGPIDLNEVPASERAYWRHWNPVLEAFEREVRSNITARLNAVLKHGLTCDHPKAKPLADLMMEGYRAALITEDIIATSRSAPILDRYPIKPVWAFAYFTKEGLREQLPGASNNALNTAAAEYLSRGVPAGQSRRYAITRNHVDRACKQFLASLHGRVNSAPTQVGRDNIIRAAFFVWTSRLDSIETLARDASGVAAYRGKTGTELVAAIDRLHGVHKSYYRALEKQHLKWPA